MLRFGTFELDEDAGQLRRDGAPVRLPPQPFRLLVLLASRPGELISREEIRQQLWGEDTYVDFDQGVNFCIKQVRSALRDDADRPLYVETVPKRGYRFIAPIERPAPATPLPPPIVPSGRGGMDSKLQRALWANIADLRMAETRRRRRRKTIAIVAAVVLAVAAGILLAIVYR
jgi:DNA-binding winged helix-turn-helix (wHTH) protein